MTDVPVLLAGDGHSAAAAYRGLLAHGFTPALCTRDPLLGDLGPRSQIFRDLAPAIDALGPRLVIAAGYRPIIPEALLARVPALNVHHSLLPRYRGLHALVWALLNGDDRVGFTIHEIDELVDHGPILWQASVETGARTSRELMEDLDELIERSIGWVVDSYLEGDLKARAQDHSAATFVGRRHPEDSRVDWQWSATYFSRVLRALVPPYPRPYFHVDGIRWEITRAEVLPRAYTEIPGRVVYRDQASVWIKLDDGLLRLYEVTNETGPQAARDVIRTCGLRLA